MAVISRESAVKTLDNAQVLLARAFEQQSNATSHIQVISGGAEVGTIELRLGRRITIQAVSLEGKRKHFSVSSIGESPDSGYVTATSYLKESSDLPEASLVRSPSGLRSTDEIVLFTSTDPPDKIAGTSTPRVPISEESLAGAGNRFDSLDAVMGIVAETLAKHQSLVGDQFVEVTPEIAQRAFTASRREVVE